MILFFFASQSIYRSCREWFSHSAYHGPEIFLSSGRIGAGVRNIRTNNFFFLQSESFFLVIITLRYGMIYNTRACVIFYGWLLRQTLCIKILERFCGRFHLWISYIGETPPGGQPFEVIPAWISSSTTRSSNRILENAT